MRIQRLPGPVRDPFMAAVRRRHPDVDIVLLPAPTPQAGPPAPEATRSASAAGHPAPRASAEGLVARVAATSDRLWSSAADDPAVALRSREDALVAGPAVGAVAGRSRLVADTADGDGVLSRLAAVLREEGWRIERTGGAVHRLSAVGAGQTLRVTHAPGSGGLMLEVLSAAVDVGPGTARLLLEGAR